MDLLQVCWNFLCTVVGSTVNLVEAAGIFTWDLLVAFHNGYPRLEGLVIGITLAWLMSRRDRHPLIKAVSAPLKLVVDILDLIWDQCVEFLGDVWGWHLGHWKKLGSWISAGYGWCKLKVVSCWSWVIGGLGSIKERLSKKDKSEEK